MPRTHRLRMASRKPSVAALRVPSDSIFKPTRRTITTRVCSNSLPSHSDRAFSIPKRAFRLSETGSQASGFVSGTAEIGAHRSAISDDRRAVAGYHRSAHGRAKLVTRPRPSRPAGSFGAGPSNAPCGAAESDRRTAARTSTARPHRRSASSPGGRGAGDRTGRQVNRVSR